MLGLYIGSIVLTVVLAKLTLPKLLDGNEDDRDIIVLTTFFLILSAIPVFNLVVCLFYGFILLVSSRRIYKTMLLVAKYFCGIKERKK